MKLKEIARWRCLSIAAILMMAFAPIVSAETEKVGNYTWQYSVVDGKAWIGSGVAETAAIFPKPVGEVTVPSKLGGYEVWRLDDYALYGCDEMTSIVIPDCVTSIGTDQFKGCEKLSSITIPDTVTSIGKGAFWLTAIEGITIPNSVTNIGSSAFAHCYNLTNVVLSAGVRSIDNWSFYQCSNLVNVVLSDNITSIGLQAFQGCASLTNIVIPSSVRTIGQEAFNCCYGLTDVVVPNSVTNIGKYAFSRCTGLQSLTLPFIGSERGNSGTEASVFGHVFGANAYEGLTNIVQYYSGSSRYIPKSLKFIRITDETIVARSAFAQCGLAEKIQINEGVRAVEQGAFMNCCALTEVELPTSVTNIGQKTFLGCTSLTSLVLPFVGSRRGNDSTSECVFGWLFPTSSANGKDCVPVRQWYHGGNSTFYIPKSLRVVNITDETIIPYGAFDNCSNLTSVVIGNSVTNIAKGAFSGCGRLECMTLPFIGSERGNHDTDDSVFGYVFGPDSYYGGTMTLQHYTGPNPSPTTTNYLPSVLKSVTITDETLVGYGAFYQCVNLTDVVINGGVDELGGFSFRYCSRMKSFKIPESVKRISMSAFAMGTGGQLEKIFIPLGVTNIEGNAFQNCTSLKLAYVPRRFKGNLRASVFQNCAADLQVIYYDENMRFFDETLRTEDNSTTNLVAVCTNDCRVTFKWKCSCEPLIKGRPYDYLSFSIDGVHQTFICGETGWTTNTFTVTGDGEHVFTWTYQKDEEGAEGEDCGWVKQVVVAPLVTLSFDGGEAESGTAPAAMSFYADDDTAVLPECGTLAHMNHSFAGWSDGETIYAAGSPCPYLEAAQTLTAVWTANTLSAPVITAPATYEADYATVTITADEGTAIYYTLDGSVPNPARPEASPYLGPFTVEGSATVRAIAVRDNCFDSEVSEFEMTRLTWTFGEYLNCPERTFSPDDGTGWVRAKGVSTDGFALRSGVIGDNATSRLETVVFGAGTVTFLCKVDGEIGKKMVYDGLAFCIDGVQQGELMGENSWLEKSFEVTGDGRHVLGWYYVKDEDGNGGGEDCAWLDCVSWAADDPLPALDSAATDGDAAAVVAGLLDVRLSEKVIGTAAYAAFRTWVDGKGLSHTTVRDAPNAWLSYALDAPGLMAKPDPLAGEDIVIESLEPSSGLAGTFDLVFGVGGVEIGTGARLAEALGVVGAAALDGSTFTSDGLTVSLERTANGKAKATVTPDGIPPAFFLRVRVK